MSTSHEIGDFQQIWGLKIRLIAKEYLRGGEQGSEAFGQNGRGSLDKDTGHAGLKWFGNDVAVVVGKHSFKWIHVLMSVV